MILVFDTETSGLTHDKLPAEDTSQPALVQLGAVLYDGRWNKTGAINLLIKPDGWSIEPEAERHHGISTARCQRHGVPLVAALAPFRALASNAFQIVAHHMNFDRKVIDTALFRAGSDGLWWKRLAPRMLCTMEIATPVLQLPGQFNSFKYPSLKEAHDFFYLDQRFEEKHEAEHDIAGAAAIVQALQQRGAWPKASLGAG